VTPNAREGPDTLRAWLVAFAGTVAMVATFGTPYAFGVFLAYVGGSYDYSTVALSAVFSVMLFMFYAGAGVIGFFGARFPARTVLFGCVLVLVGISPALFIVESYVALVVVFSLLGAAPGVVYVVLAGVVPLWFERRRGVATGLLFSGIGLSLLIAPLVWQFAFERLGVPAGFASITLGTAAVCLLAAVVCRRPPWADNPSASRAQLGRWLAALVRRRQFHFHFIGLGLSLSWYYLLAAYSIELFVARGLSERAAALAFGLIGGISIVSRITSGYVADRTSYRRVFYAALALVIAGNVVLLFPSIPLIYLAVVLFGLGFGGIATLYIPILLQTYDADKSVAIIAVFNVSFGLFALGLPPLGIAFIARTGSYVPVIALTLATSLGALGCFVYASAADG